MRNGFCTHMKTVAAVVCVAVGLLARVVGGTEERPTRLDVASEPDGARVFVDGQLKGTTPCSVFELAPGRHLVHVEAAACRPVDAFVYLDDGAFVQKTYALEAEKALMLLRSEPAGADVKYAGVSLGVTPLLVSTLPTDHAYTFELVKNGYQTKKIDVVPVGRTPLVREETLALDSGVIDCSSEPAGATVTVNGVERGVTPLHLTHVPKGLATITLKRAGYHPETRELRLVPGDRQTLAVKLRGLPAKLKVVSSPEQARVFLDGNYQGKTPTTIANVAPGRHELRIERPGHAPQTQTVQLGNGEEKTATFKMESVMGRVEIVTTPPGARVFVDGRSMGTTRSQGGDSPRSQTLMLENVPAGERAVVVRLDGYQEEQRKVVVSSKETRKVYLKLVRLFVPDTEIETIRGTYRGVLVEKSILGDITLEVKKGVMTVFPHADIRKITPLAK